MVGQRRGGVESGNSNQGFAVKRAVNSSGAYESALQSLLMQFAQDSDRPVAQLNNDPVTGKRTLSSNQPAPL